MPVAQDIRKGDAQVIDWGRANSLTKGYIQDSAKHWADNQWRGHYVRIRGGLNDCTTAVIKENSENRLHLQAELPVAPQHGDESTYEILTLQVDPSIDIVARLEQLETKLEETNLVLRQIREGIGLLVERNLAEVYPET